ncbi:hypothetical protein GCM10025795_06150 [Verticiella sediminum]
MQDLLEPGIALRTVDVGGGLQQVLRFLVLENFDAHFVSSVGVLIANVCSPAARGAAGDALGTRRARCPVG